MCEKRPPHWAATDSHSSVQTDVDVDRVALRTLRIDIDMRLPFRTSDMVFQYDAALVGLSSAHARRPSQAAHCCPMPRSRRQSSSAAPTWIDAEACF